MSVTKRDARVWLSLDTSGEVWLHLIAPSGLSALLNVGSLNDRFKGGIVESVIRELAQHALDKREKFAGDTINATQPAAVSAALPVANQQAKQPAMKPAVGLRSQCCGSLVCSPLGGENYTCLMCKRTCSTQAPFVGAPTQSPAPAYGYWQPMDTFPMDGKFYLARGDNYGDSSRGSHMAVVRFSAAHEVHTSATSDIFEPVDDCVYSYLTHWTTLPGDVT